MINQLFSFFLRLGIWGPFVLGIIDGPLFAPLANDVLLVALITQHRDLAWGYAASSVVGSVLGVLLLDVISRKGGEVGLKKTMSPKKFERMKKAVTERGTLAIVLACLMPPPFPFTAILGAASALQYSRSKMMIVVTLTRILRFAILTWLALRYGKQILHWSEMPVVRWSVVALIVLSIGGSVWAILQRVTVKRDA